MQQGLKEKQSSASSRASSFFIENILAGGQDGHRSSSKSGGGDAGAETVSAGSVQSARQAESDAPVPDTSDAAFHQAYVETHLQWHRDATGSNFRPLDGTRSKCKDPQECF